MLALCEAECGLQIVMPLDLSHCSSLLYSWMPGPNESLFLHMIAAKGACSARLLYASKCGTTRSLNFERSG